MNEFINRKENESIRQALIDSKAKNSIRREEYEFVGKRKKVLVLKQSSNQITKTTLSWFNDLFDWRLRPHWDMIGSIGD